MLKNKKVLLSIFLAGAMLFSTACGQAPAESSKPVTESTAEALPVDTDPMGKYDPPIKIIGALSSLDATVKSTDDSNPDNNVWSRAYRDELGIEVENLWSANATQGNEKVNLAIASGEIPDVFRVNQVQFQQLVEADLLADITDAYNNYSGEFMKDVMTRPGSDTALKACTRDGKIYGIPYFLNMTDDTRVMYIRSDWMKKLGLEEPKSFQDLMAVAKAFQDQDPDGNGEKDTIALPLESTVFKPGSGVFRGFMNSFHAYPFAWVADGDKLVNGLVQAEPMKKGLAELAKMYSEGYIRQDFSSYSWDDQFIPDLMNNKIGMTFGGLWEGWWPLGDMKVADPTVEWKMYPLFSADDKPAKSQSAEIMVNGITVIRKGYEHPEALVKMANLCNEKMWTSDPETFRQFGYDSSGNNPWLYCQVYFEFPGKNYTMYQKTSEALETGDITSLNGEETLIYNWMKEYEDGTDLGRWGIYLSYGPNSSCEQIDYYLENDLYEYDKFYGNPPKSQLNNEALLSDMFAEYAIKIVTGEYPIEKYDEFVSEWHAQGGQEWTDDINLWYDDQK